MSDRRMPSRMIESSISDVDYDVWQLLQYKEWHWQWSVEMIAHVFKIKWIVEQIARVPIGDSFIFEIFLEYRETRDQK